MSRDRTARDRSGMDRATLMAAVQIIFGIVIFTSAWWLSPEQLSGTALYIFGFITVLMGIVNWVMFSSRRGS